MVAYVSTMACATVMSASNGKWRTGNEVPSEVPAAGTEAGAGEVCAVIGLPSGAPRRASIMVRAPRPDPAGELLRL